MNRAAICLLLIFASIFGAEAQEETGVIKTNPFGWFVGQYQFGYEHFLSEKVSVQLLPGGIFGKETLSSIDSLNTEFLNVSATRGGVIVIPEFRYYLGGEAPDGLYIAPFGRFRSVKTTLDIDPSSSRKRRAIGGGFVLGYQYQLANGLTGEVFFGPQFKSSTTSTEGDFDGYGFNFDDESDTGVRFGFTIGLGL